MLAYLQMIETEADRSKFEELYIRYRQQMYAIAMSILHNEYDAEDAVHQAFVTIAENIEKILDPKCLKTKAYIVTIIESKSIDLYRFKKKRHIVPFTEDYVGLSIEYTGSNELAKCMRKLPTQYRQVLLLKFHCGYHSAEIAEMMGITLVNALKIEQRAKAKLKSLCEEAEIL